MRCILVDNARRKRTLKRGGALARRELDEAELLAPEPREDLLALDRALTLLSTTDPTAAELVQLRYFGGLSVADAAQMLGLSQRSAERLWTYTRVWLLDHIKNAGPDDEHS
jgi:RNA polymerase sigma factor (TIGR02999 family)